MTLLDQVLGDRVGTYLLVSCLLVATLATIAAIIDIPLRALEQAGFAEHRTGARSTAVRLTLALGALASGATFAGAAAQAYFASSPGRTGAEVVPFFLATNVGFLISVCVWGLAGPLRRHWELSLGAFGLGLAITFLLFGVVLRLRFEGFGLLASERERLIFATAVGGILWSLGTCIAAILAMLAYVLAGALRLSTQHRLHALDASIGAVPSAPRTVLAAIRRHQRAGNHNTNQEAPSAAAPAETASPPEQH